MPLGQHVGVEHDLFRLFRRTALTGIVRVLFSLLLARVVIIVVAQVRQTQNARYLAIAERFRKEAATWYGEEGAKKVKHAEAFEICEYGTRPTEADIKRLFPFLP